MLGGETIEGRRAHDIGLVDALAEGDLLDAALDFTRALAERNERPRRARDLHVRLHEPQAWFAARRRALDKAGVQGLATRTILGCIEAGVTLPVEDASNVADAGTRALIESQESKALRYLFFAERQAGKIEAVAPEARRRIERVALVGAAGDLERMLGQAGIVRSNEDPDLVITTSLAAEEQTKLRALDTGTAPHVAFAITGDFGEWQRLRAMLPERIVLGLRFTGRAAELVREPQADPALLDALARLLRRLGKACVPCAPAQGFIIERLHAAAARQALASAAPAEIGQRCMAAMAAEGQALLDEGVAERASDIDVALVAAGVVPGIHGGPMFATTGSL
jgi:3-hydroxyacyl-CoA dehydrogenase